MQTVVTSVDLLVEPKGTQKVGQMGESKAGWLVEQKVDE